MKKIILLSIILIGLISCNQYPVINQSNNEFVIRKIKKYNSTHSEYVSEHYKGNRAAEFFSPSMGKIILPTGWYNIGDTIKLQKQ